MIQKSALCLLFLSLLMNSACKQKDTTNTKLKSSGTSVPAVSEKDLIGDADPIANASAVPGGTFVTWGSAWPKSLNVFLDNNSFSSEVTGLQFESLISLHSTENKFIGVLADSWVISEDKRTFTFKIHEQAKWSDGKPVTAGDIQFYYDVIMNPKNLTSVFRVGLKRFSRPEVLDDKTIRITATEVHWSNFHEAGGMTAFPRHVWKDSNFNKQNFNFPVVSGPYNLHEVKKNRSITLKRRPDWWGRVKKYNLHKYNFDQVKYKFMTDRNKALEAFKKGDWDAYPIYTSSIWMKKTPDLPQVKKGWVVRQKVINKEPIGFQGMAINLRREKFKDVKVREALCYLLNRELMNEKLMYNQYFLLNTHYPDLYPNNTNPHSPLRLFHPDKARKLLAEAGFKVNSKGELNKNGKKISITFITFSKDHRHLNIYIEQLKKIGINAKMEQLSLSSVRKRLDKHDYDMFWISWGAGRLRDPESQWHSSTANQEASNNIPGVKDPFIDSLIELQKTEMDINKRNDILRMLDGRLNKIIPYVLLWQSDHHRILYWNKFGTPNHVFDKYNREDAIIPYWWHDGQKARELESAMKNNTQIPLEPAVVTYSE